MPNEEKIGGIPTIRRTTVEDAAEIAVVEMLTAPEFATFQFEGMFGDTSVGAALAWRYSQGGVDSTEWSWIAHLREDVVAAMGAYPVTLAMREWVSGPDDGTDSSAHFLPIRQMMRPEAFHISRLGVLPAFRRQGLARAMVDTACRVAIDRGSPVVTLVVWADNQPALALYESLGFTEFDRTEIAPHPGLARHGTSLMLGKSL